jgi:quercetin dioxygenase-like cupin family protein
MHFARGRTGEPTRNDAGISSGNPTASNILLESALDAGEHGVRVSNAVFQPGSRTHWHTHSQGQLFFIEHGRGMIATEDEQQVVAPGDLVYTAPLERHWHGAAPEAMLVYTAVSMGDTAWLDEVDDTSYTDAWQ